MLVTPDADQLIDLPKQPPAMNGIKRTAKLKLDSSGTLTGEVQELRVGDRACIERRALLTATNARDQIKLIEVQIADCVPTFHIIKASMINLHQNDQPFAFNYSFEAQNYLSRMRILPTGSSPGQ